MHKNATKCKQNTKQLVYKHGASNIIDTFETYHPCGENFACCITLYLDLQLVAIQEEELLPSSLYHQSQDKLVVVEIVVVE
jgi:hypothetical protein